MPYKICPTCRHSSYSSCVGSIWLCPYCGKELTLCQAVYNRRRLPVAENAPAPDGGGLYMFKRG